MFPPGVSGGNRCHPLNLNENGFNTPETSATQYSNFDVLFRHLISPIAGELDSPTLPAFPSYYDAVLFLGCSRKFQNMGKQVVQNSQAPGRF